ncbi:MAG: hypothetical protein GTO46_03535 [Gemmatimonadetes bacterium]|nr:hypothetical protein [Gemmatimonadota bacterium]NIO32872.1 hypothetical protein [Gemmatimonadota bacterium]
MPADTIFQAFLARQHSEGMALAESSDLLHLQPLGPLPAQHYLAQFRCRGLVRERGSIGEADSFLVGVMFPEDYLRCRHSTAVVTMLEPNTVWHPNIRGPAVCLGRMPGGTTLVDILYQVFEIITYNKVTMREDDALNKEACSWTRNNLDRFPIDTRPLKRRTRPRRADAVDAAPAPDEGAAG